MKLTNPKVVKHLEEGYFVRRKAWDELIGIAFNGVHLVLLWSPIEKSYPISIDDIKANDWVCCPKK